MAFDQQTGTASLRKEVVDSVIKGRADAEYKFKQAVTISKTNAWKNTFFREDTTVLSGASGNNTKGIPRGAAFPQAIVTWEEVSKRIEKYGLEDFVLWEDILTNDIDVQRRTMFRIAEGVVKAVDDEIWDILTESQSPSAIQSVTLTGGQTWDASSAAIIDDLMNAKQLIGEKNYNTSNLMCFISERDHRSVVNYLAEKGAQFPSIGTQAARNGRIGALAGINFVVSNSVTASFALVVVPKVVGTWKQAVALSTDVEVDPYKGTRIRSVEMGVTQLTDPSAAVLIINTQSASA